MGFEPASLNFCDCHAFIRDINGVLRSANRTEYGLAAGVFTRDINKALHVSDRLLAGTVFVNTYNKTDVAAPFGGYKQSGFGKDLGSLSCKRFRLLHFLIHDRVLYQNGLTYRRNYFTT